MGGIAAAEAKHGGCEDESRPSSDDEAAQLLNGEFETFDIEEEPYGDPERSQVQELRKFSHRYCGILHGPQPPRIQSVSPLLPSVQSLPIRLLERWAPESWKKGLLLFIYLCFWAVAFIIPLLKGKGAVADDAGRTVRHLSCTDTLWQRDNKCGLDGIDCRPFANDSFAFRCPANCASAALLNPHHVGLQDVNYRPLVVGGPVYRGDSFLCGSAIHAGIVDDGTGGCGAVTLLGNYYQFYSSEQNGIESIGFDSYFPLSFSVAEDPRLRCSNGDPRPIMLPVSIFFTAVLSIFTTSPAVMFFASFVGIYAHVGLVLDPIGVSSISQMVLPTLFSWFTRTFLPSMFCAVVLYFTCVKRSLQGLTAQLEKAILWLGGLWFGAMANYKPAWVPLSRLTIDDLEQQPGAKVALAIILVILTGVIVQQAYAFWLEGRLPCHLAMYGLFLMIILFGIALPSLELRIHHYILALLLLPATSVQTRPALLYQGFLLGLFINGVARWGFVPILETAPALRGDGSFGSALPDIVDPLIYLDTPMPNISFKWKTSPWISQYDGVSILVNDVERYRGFFAEEPVPDETFTWTRLATLNTPEYFRFAYIKDGHALDYTEAATWFVNGTWRRGKAFY